MSMKSVPLYWLQYQDICSEQSYTQFLMSTENLIINTQSISSLLIDSNHQSDAVIIIIYQLTQ